MFRFVASVSVVSVAMCAAGLAHETSGSGQIAFNTHCRQCHSMKKGDNRLGPSLYGIFGEKAG